MCEHLLNLQEITEENYKYFRLKKSDNMAIFYYDFQLVLSFYCLKVVFLNVYKLVTCKDTTHLIFCILSTVLLE